MKRLLILLLINLITVSFSASFASAEEAENSSFLSYLQAETLRLQREKKNLKKDLNFYLRALEEAENSASSFCIEDKCYSREDVQKNIVNIKEKIDSLKRKLIVSNEKLKELKRLSVQLQPAFEKNDKMSKALKTKTELLKYKKKLLTRALVHLEESSNTLSKDKKLKGALLEEVGRLEFMLQEKTLDSIDLTKKESEK